MAVDSRFRRLGVVRLARRIEPLQALYERSKNRRRAPQLAEHIAVDGVGAELGGHKGQFSRVLVDKLRPSRFYVVDPWYLLSPSWDWAGGDRSTVNGLRRTLRAMRSELESGVVSVVIGDDREFLAGLPDAHLDWAYIDTSHAYAHTIDELVLLREKVRPGGVIAGDDWQSAPDHPHHGVARAVREQCEAGGLTFLFADDRTHQWAVRRD